MSRSCHSAMFSKAAWALARTTPRQPADLLAGHRIPLVRHRRAALLPGGERLLRLAHLGALQVPDFERDLLAERRSPAPAPRRRRRAGRAGSPARRSAAGFSPSSRADPLLGLRADVPERAHRARRSCRPAALRRRPGSASGSRPASSYQIASFRPKVIGSAWMPCVRPICDGVLELERAAL